SSTTATTDREALVYVRQIAEAGNARAAFVLAECLSEGIGCPQDFAEALKWYAAGAELGDTSSMAALGRMYSTGNGVLQDFVRAHTWLNLAAARGDRPSSVARDRLARSMTPDDVALAQMVARRWDEDHRPTA
ncbi:tetratricopeptide repeat protein, partial [Devosia insulae]|uniref:tetratricopeptide repeat protein n=1 Tax=Devosia insulae TaxID=408174 RepID=UPI00114CBA67